MWLDGWWTLKEVKRVIASDRVFRVTTQDATRSFAFYFLEQTRSSTNIHRQLDDVLHALFSNTDMITSVVEISERTEPEFVAAAVLLAAGVPQEEVLVFGALVDHYPRIRRLEKIVRERVGRGVYLFCDTENQDTTGYCQI